MRWNLYRLSNKSELSSYSRATPHLYCVAGSTFSVKTQFNSEEHWTKAMKYMLTNLKWGLAWVTSKYTRQE